jgi:hypothetical protein
LIYKALDLDDGAGARGSLLEPMTEEKWELAAAHLERGLAGLAGLA